MGIARGRLSAVTLLPLGTVVGAVVAVVTVLVANPATAAAAPKISSVSPTTTSAGKTITISGTGFSGVSAVQVHSVAASYPRGLLEQNHRDSAVRVDNGHDLGVRGIHEGNQPEVGDDHPQPSRRFPPTSGLCTRP